MRRKFSSPVLERYVAFCLEHGLKITPQRSAIYRVMMESTDHPCTEVVFRRVLAYYPAMSFDTVNRSLLTFAELGLIDIVESVSGVRRYDPNVERHHHLHCIKCGTIVDFCHPDFDAIPAPPAVTENFTILGKRVIFSGICSLCNADAATQAILSEMVEG
jgi:Fur family peroxide stress response transcriptional regulator